MKCLCWRTKSAPHTEDFKKQSTPADLHLISLFKVRASFIFRKNKIQLLVSSHRQREFLPQEQIIDYQ